MPDQRPGAAAILPANLAIERASAAAADRPALWRQIASAMGAETVAEVGVWKGEFAADLLRSCPTIRAYYMLDPWRHLSGWNKPFNVPDEHFEAVRREAMERTAFAGDRRHVLRGTTVEVAGDLPDRSLDLCYIDGDHTLRGIVIDLIRLFPKVRDGGVLAGDDFAPSAWQHDPRFEPTLVFPAALYFAEATGSLVYGLPHDQFAIVVDRSRDSSEFRDLTRRYSEPTLAAALRGRRAGLLERTIGKLARRWSR
jgi:8-oxo-dGTP pyrophosphatase MutT (NUDIX family)